MNKLKMYSIEIDYPFLSELNKDNTHYRTIEYKYATDKDNDLDIINGNHFAFNESHFDCCIDVFNNETSTDFELYLDMSIDDLDNCPISRKINVFISANVREVELPASLVMKYHNWPRLFGESAPPSDELKKAYMNLI